MAEDQRSRLQIVSDLHLEVGCQYATFSIPVTAPYLVLAGDIGRLLDYDELLHDFLAPLVPRYRRVFYVLGNHEFFGMSYAEGIEAAQCLENEPSLQGKLTLLNCGRWTEEERGAACNTSSPRLTVIGCTLWSWVPEEARDIVQAKVGDFRKMTARTVADHNAQHRLEAAWLRRQVEETRQNSQSVVCVVTHHAPSLQGTSRPEHATNPWTSGFATEMLGEEGGPWSEGVDLWVYGHTHHCVDQVCHGVRLLANQRGYAIGDGSVRSTEALGNRARVFDPGLTVDL